MSVAHEKKLAAEAAAQLVEDGMIVGLGTGSTVAYLLPALAVRGLDLRCVATSPATEHLAPDLGRITSRNQLDRALPQRSDVALLV
jgi:ribose 5-phosphate isomerase A